MFFDITNCLHELGTAARRATDLCEQLQYNARAQMFFDITNYLHEQGTAARRVVAINSKI